MRSRRAGARFLKIQASASSDPIVQVGVRYLKVLIEASVHEGYAHAVMQVLALGCVFLRSRRWR